MNNFKLEKCKHVHFVGVGGVSMHALAIYCKDMGLMVSGSDISNNKYVKMCKEKGIKTYKKHKRSNIDGADLVVCTGAVAQSNIEVIEANVRGIKVVDRAELLSVICKNFKCVIGVAGTHGKSTTSAMIYHILSEAGKKVSCHIGADVEGARLNPYDEYLVLECCEYNKSFLKFNCDIAVILNIENDHLDCYSNMYNLRHAFIKFLKQSKVKFVFNNASTKCIMNKRINCINRAEIVKDNIFVVEGKRYVLSNVYGEHNIDNATAAINVCKYLGLSYAKIYNGLKTFMAIGRRCETLARVDNCDIMTDYAHHPTEIKATYTSLQAKYKRIRIIFQPHTYSRTKLLIHEFVKVFGEMDGLVIFKEYSARENQSKGYSAKQLCKYLDNSVYIKNFGLLKKYVKQNKLHLNNDCIVFMGAGNIDEVGRKLLKWFK